MKIKKFEQANIKIAEDQPEFNTVPAYANNDDGSVLFGFDLDDEEIEKLKETKSIWVKLLTGGRPMQPIATSVEFEELFNKSTGSLPENFTSIIKPNDLARIMHAWADLKGINGTIEDAAAKLDVSKFPYEEIQKKYGLTSMSHSYWFALCYFIDAGIKATKSRIIQ